MRRHDIRFPLRGRVWAAVPFFCACPLRREWAAVPFFFVPVPAHGSDPPCGAWPADSGWNIRSVRGGMCGLNGMEPPVCGAECAVGGGFCAGEEAGHAPQVSRAEGGMSRSADGDSRRRAGSGSASRSTRRARARKGFRETGCIRRGALSAADRVGWKAHPGVGGKTKSGFREKTAFVV